MKEKYDPKNWRRELHFDRIKPAHIEVINAFQTHQKDLKDFLIEDAFKSQEMCVSNTFLVFDKADYNRWKRRRNSIPPLLGYIAVLNDSIR